jgi:hypothetical protein
MKKHSRMSKNQSNYDATNGVVSVNVQCDITYKDYGFAYMISGRGKILN